MPAPARNRSRKKPTGSLVFVVAVLLLIAVTVAGYFFFSKSASTIPKKTGAPEAGPVVTPIVPPPSLNATATEPPPQSPRKELKEPAASIHPKEAMEPVGGDSACLAIIIDDMGSSLTEARSLSAIKVPLTFAIIPGLRADREVAAYADANAIETMVHIPMQSKGWPARRLEANGLLMSMDTDELQERVSVILQRLPGVHGVNNHMGSEFTESEEKMSAVLQTLKKNNLFFIDSVTSSNSVGQKLARRAGIRSARRNVFLDNEQERGYILGQLDQAVGLARKNGSAIAICHPHPATIAALASALPGLAAKGVKLVPASRLVR